MTIVEQIIRYGMDHPDKTALSNGKQSVSYGVLVNNILLSRNILTEEYRLSSGDKVIIAANKELEFVAVYLACHLIGVITLPIAPDTNPTRYALIKKKTSPSLIIGMKDEDPSCRVIGIDRFRIDESAAMPIDLEEISYPDPDLIADIIYTTGTTGEPKGVQLSHKNITAAALNINTFIDNKEDDTELLALPISHSFGLGRMRCALSNGQTLIMLGSFANIKRFFRYMEEYNVNGFGMVPASWALIKKLSGDEIKNYKDQLHYIEIGSAPMPREDKLMLCDLLPDTRICMHYGLTEASRSAFIEFHSEIDHLDTIGRQSPNMDICIIAEDGEPAGVDTEGEICVKGDAVTAGYYDLPKDDYFINGYFKTGDWGRMDKDGYITLISRKKELINVGGKKVSPIEVEEVLKKLDYVNDCVCTAIPDPDGILGEVVKAYIVSDVPEKITFETIDPLIGAQLEGFKHPVVYEMISEIPKTSSGKIQRLSL